MTDSALAAWSSYVDEVKAHGLPRGVEYIRQGAHKWQKKGRGKYTCLSPLRPDRNVGSFFVEEGGRWYDFATSEGGDVFGFIEKKRGCDFKEAVDEMARFCGLPTWDERRAKTSNGAGGASLPPEELVKMWKGLTTERSVFAALTAIVHLCHDAMPARVREHLRVHVGLEDDFIDLEKIGWCPPGLWEMRQDFLPGFGDEVLLATGFFLKQSYNQTVHPSLSQRIIFPYWKESLCRYAIGREYHFGRPADEVFIADWDKGKYKKLPLHDEEKRPYIDPCVQNLLWGEDSLRIPAGAGLAVFITEGVTDAAMLRQLGYPVVSPVTIQIREDDYVRAVQLLGRAKDVIIVNDEDTKTDARSLLTRHPGLEGAKRMAERLWQAKIPVRIGRLPKPPEIAKVDVNDVGRQAMVRGGEAEARTVFDLVAAQALPYPDFLVEELPADANSTVLTDFLKRLGAISTDLTELEQEERLARIFARSKSYSKRLVAKTFKAARLEALALLRSKEPPKEQRVAEAAKAQGRTTPLAKTEAMLIEDLGCYERMDGSGTTRRISNFSLTVHRLTINEQGGADCMVCRVMGTDRDILAHDWTIPHEAWTGRRSFFSSFPNVQMNWFGDDGDIQLLGDLISRDAKTLPRVRATGIIGRHGEGENLRFVLPAGTIDLTGTWMEKPDLVFAIENKSSITSNNRLSTKRSVIDSPEIRELAKTFFEQIPTMHEPEGIAIITAWWMSTFFRPELIRQLSAHPILNIHASPGAGKTSLFSRVFWKVFAGVSQGDALSCTSSPFVFAKDMSSTNALALVFDEFKTGDIGTVEMNRFRRNLRRVYTGEAEGRGTANQGINSYMLSAPIAVLGESRLDNDQALVERCAFVLLDGNWIAQHPENRERWSAFKRQPWEQVAPWLQAWSLRADVDRLVVHAKERTHATLVELGRITIPERVIVMLTTITFGLLAQEEVCGVLGAITSPLSLIALFRRLLSQSLGDDELGIGTHARSHFDEFMVDASTMANLGLLKVKQHYLFAKGLLYVWVEGVESVRDEWRRGRGLPGISPGVRALVHQAHEMTRSPEGSYVLAVSRRVRLETQLRCVELDPNKIPPSLGIAEFPAEFEEPAKAGTSRAPTPKELVADLRIPRVEN